MLPNLAHFARFSLPSLGTQIAKGLGSMVIIRLLIVSLNALTSLSEIALVKLLAFFTYLAKPPRYSYPILSASSSSISTIELR